MNKNTLTILAVLGGVYLLSRQKSTGTSTPSATSSNNNPPSLPEPTYVVSNEQYQSQPVNNDLSLIGEIMEEEMPIIDYKNWRGENWSNWFKLFSQNYTDKEKAIKDAFVIWSDPRNPYKNVFLSDKQFILALAMGERLPKLYNADVAGLRGIGAVITWSSTPVYDTWTNWWYGTTVWGCPEWIEWHRQLKIKYGASDARYRWNSGAQHPDNQYGGGAFHSCLSDCDFYKYQVQNNLWRPSLPLTGTYTWLMCDVGGAVTNVTNTAVSISEGLAITGKALTYAIPVATAVATYFLYKKYIAKNGKAKR